MATTNSFKNTFLSFLVGNEYFAVPVSKVLKVLEKQPISQVPNSPEYIKGVISFRGEVISVIKTHLKFGLPTPEENSKYVIITLELKRGEDVVILGAYVDRVKDVIQILDEDIKPIPEMDNNFDTSYLTGIYEKDNHFIMLLDVDKVFSKQEMTEVTTSSSEFTKESVQTTK